MDKKAAVTKQPKALYQLRIGTRVFAVVTFLVVFIGLFLSKDYLINRNVLVETSPDKVASYLSKPENWPDWLYIEKGRLFSKGGFGGEFDIIYDSGKTGSLSFELIGDGFVNFTVTPLLGQNPVSNTIHWQLNANGLTRISWTISGRLESGLLSSYLAFFANKIAGANFEKGLQQLQNELPL